MDTTVVELVTALQSATSQDPAQVKQAEEWLKQQEIRENFYLKLSAICRMHEIDWPARWMSAIYLKNGIDKCWRPCSTLSISTESKEQIKDNILHCMGEPMNQIALQIFVVISKISRIDYPEQWSSLMPFLFSGVSSPTNDLHQMRCLSTLRHVVKTLSLKKLPHAKEVFARFCSENFDVMFQYWTACHDSLKNYTENNRRQNIPDAILENSVNTTKIIYYMLQNYDDAVLTKIYLTCFGNLFEIMNMTHLLGAKQNHLCKKISIILVKALDSLLAVGDKSYFIGAQKTMSVLCEQIHGRVAHENDDLDEKFVVKCVNACKGILDNPNFYEVFMDNPEDLSKVGPAIETLFQCLVSHYLPLKEQDLMLLEDDAEEFCSEEFGESWKFNLRPSAEVLSLTLLKKFPDFLVLTLLKMLDVVQDLSTDSLNEILSKADPVLQVILKGCTSTLECMVRKEAVYYMVGLALYDVIDVLNFENWVINKLLPEVRAVQTEIHGKLIHRRVLWLISQWCGVKLPEGVRSTLYMFVVTSMQKCFDMAVRLTASSTMQYLLDDFEFDINQFQDYQDGSFQGLYELLMEVKNCDTKMRILNVISFLIERLGPAVAQYRQTISNIIPHLWTHAATENHDLLKCAIMGMIIQFIHGLGDKSESITHLTIPLIQDSTDLDNPSHIYLLEDGLELWLAALQHCPNANQAFLSLFKNIFPVLEYGSETLKTCFSIIESYVLLFGESLLREYGQKLDGSFASSTSDVRNQCLVLVSGLVSIFVDLSRETSPVYCPTYCKRALKATLRESDSVLLSVNFSLAANIIIKNIVAFFGLIKEISHDCSQEFSVVLQNFIKIWCDSIDTIVESDKKKLSALALLILCSNIKEVPAVAIAFHNIICAVVHILYDVCDETGQDSMIHVEDGLYREDNLESQHDKRRRHFRKLSPVYNISLPAFVASKMKSLQDSIPPETFSHLMSTVDAQTLTELKAFLSSN